MPDKNDHDLLIGMDVKLDGLVTQFQNHLHFHRNLAIALVGVGGGLVTALIIALML